MGTKKKRSFESAFKEDGSEASGFAYAFLKAQNRSMWSELRAKKRALSRLEHVSRALQEADGSIDKALRSRNEELEKKLESAEEKEREDALVPVQKKVDEGALDAALATCGALLSERARLRASGVEIVEIVRATEEEDAVAWARAAEAREAATAARLAACEDFWRRQRVAARGAGDDDEEDEASASVRRRLEEEVATLKASVASLETQLSCRQQRIAEGDGSTLQAKLLEEIDQTGAALEDLRRQNRILSAENAQLRVSSEVDFSLKQKLESSDFVVAEMKNLLTKKRQVILDHASALDDAESRRTKAELKSDQMTRERDAAMQKIKALETLMKRHKDAFDEQASDFVDRLRAASSSDARRPPPPTPQQAPATTENSKLESKIDQIRIKALETKIQCSVCLEREKSVVLTRCYHAFCKKCIDTVIATRNRKCPACAKPFGQADVHPVFLVN